MYNPLEAACSGSVHYAVVDAMYRLLLVMNEGIEWRANVDGEGKKYVMPYGVKLKVCTGKRCLWLWKWSKYFSEVFIKA